MPRPHIGVLALCLALAARTSADEVSDFMVRHWDQGRGLPQASVTSLAQDADGFLWVGTFGGLVRFDGNSFRQVPLAGSIPVDNFEVFCLLSERDALWVGTDRGLFRVAGGVLEPVPLPPLLRGRPIAAIYRAANGTLWLGSANDGIARMVDGTFTMEPSTAGHLVPALARFAEDDRARLLIWTEKLGILRFEGGHLEKISAADSWQARQRFAPPVPGKAPAGISPWLASLPPLPDAARESYFVATTSADGTVWFGTAHGLFRTASGRAAPVPLGTERGAPVDALFRDRDGSIWAGTDGDGLYQLVPRLFRAMTDKDGLPGQSVHGLSGDDSGTIWATLACQGLARIDPVAGKVLSTWSAEELGGCPWTVLPARGGGVYVGLFEGPLARIGADGKVRSDGPRVESGTALFRDRGGQLWIGTREHGAFRLVEGEKTAVTAVDGIPSVRVTAFAEDGGGRVWVATDRGVAIWENGVVHGAITAGLPAIPIRAFLPDGDRMWVGTFGAGLAVEAKGRFVLLDVRRGLFENVVSWMQAEGDWIWWTGNRGVYRASRKELLSAAADPARIVHPQRFSRSEGMPSDETNGGAQPAGWKDATGRLWIPTIDGVTSVDPRALEGHRAAPRARIDHVVVDGKEIPFTGKLELAPEARHLEIDFTAATLTSPEHLWFATRIDGLDHDWIPIGSHRWAHYSRLRPGSYAFRVIATDDPDQSSGAEARLTIEQRPALTESWPFKVLVGLFILGLGAALYAARALLVRRRAERIRHAKAIREEERLEEERRYLRQQSLLLRDLHDGIGGIVTNIGMMAALGEKAEGPEAKGRTLQRIEQLAQEGSSEVRSLMNALESRELHWSDLIVEIRRHGLILVEGHEIELTLAAEGEPAAPTLDLPTGLSLFRIVKEALNNVVKHSGAKAVCVTLAFAPHRLLLSIRDDGGGLPSVPRPGRGLSNMRKRAGDLGGTLVIEPAPGLGLVFDIPISRRPPCAALGDPLSG